MNTAVEKKPRLTTSAMIASIAAFVLPAKLASQRLLGSCSRSAVQNGSNTNLLSISVRTGPLNWRNSASEATDTGSSGLCFAASRSHIWAGHRPPSALCGA